MLPDLKPVLTVAPPVGDGDACRAISRRSVAKRASSAATISGRCCRSAYRRESGRRAGARRARPAAARDCGSPDPGSSLRMHIRIAVEAVIGSSPRMLLGERVHGRDRIAAKAASSESRSPHSRSRRPSRAE